MRPASLVAVWVGCAVFGLACWVGLFYLGAALVNAWVTWPIVRVAASLGAIGAALFFLSEQYAEFRAKDDYKQQLFRQSMDAWKSKPGDGIRPLRKRFP